MLAGSDISIAEGKNGWLFLAAFGPNQYLANARDLEKWKRLELPKHIANYTARASRLRERGIPFLVLFAPEASGIYPEFLPSEMSIQVPTACEILADALTAMGVNVVCPSAKLRAAKGGVDLCQRTDSHWTSYGAYLAYRQLMEALGEPYMSRTISAFDAYFDMSAAFGDLGVHASPERRGFVQTVDLPKYKTNSAKNIFDIREKNFRQSTCTTGIGRVLVFRDSFTNALAPYLESTFHELFLIAPSPTMMDDAIDHLKPDIVILEVAERALFQCEDPFADWSHRSFAQEYLEQNSNLLGGALQVKGVKAILEGRLEEAIEIFGQANLLEGKEARSYNLAWALNLAGRYDECLALFNKADKNRTDPLLCYLAADSSYRLGKIRDALTYIDAALSLKPNHALFLFLKGAWLLQDGEPSKAKIALMMSARVAPNAASTWALLEKIGDNEGDPELASKARMAHDRCAAR